MTRGEALDVAALNTQGLRQAEGYLGRRRAFRAFRSGQGGEWIVILEGGCRTAAHLDSPDVEWRPASSVSTGG